MFYQVNATSDEFEALRKFQLSPRNPDPSANSGLSKVIAVVESLQGDDHRYKALDKQGALIAMRSSLLKIYGNSVCRSVPRPYYLIARYFQQPYGWQMLSDYERETISPMLEALLNNGTLTGTVPDGAPDLPLVVTDSDTLMTHISDTPLVARLAAAHLLVGRFVSQLPGLYTLQTFIMRDSLDLCRNCIKQAKDLKRCARCKVAFYCSSVCQAEDWKDGHKLECSTFAKAIGDAITAAEARSNA